MLWGCGIMKFKTKFYFLAMQEFDNELKKIIWIVIDEEY